MQPGPVDSSEAPTPPDSLVLGPILRHVDTTSATIWVETRSSCRVSVRTGEGEWSARTFRVHGHHYALVECEDLTPGSQTPYRVELDGTPVWPPREHSAGLALPAPVIATLPDDRPPLLLFGSCRTSVPHDRNGNLTHGVDALRAFGLAMAGIGSGDHPAQRPDLVLFLGDQVYADETSDAMRDFISAKRDIEESPGTELADYDEYAHLYQLAWTDPVNRWLLSTLPSAMIFDDHDVRDDWNTSAQWRRKMEATDWWHGRIVSGLASYWVYQHLGNLTGEERAEDEIWQRVTDHDGEDELDLTEVLDAFAERVDQQPETYRWSFARRLGEVRLVVVDSRAARVLGDEQRSMLDDEEMQWLDRKLQGDCEHLLVGTSLPFLLPEPLHHVEAFDEALAAGVWGPRGARIGERIRQGVDLEHWGAFQQGFRDVAEMILSVSRGERGRPPSTVTFLSGDVHHSYVARVREHEGHSTLLQLVCSPIRNPLPRVVRFATAAMAYGLARPIGHLVARLAKVPEPPFRWDLVKGPWFDNNIATLRVVDGGLRMSWWTGEVLDGRHDRPTLREVECVEATAEGPVHSR